jgi:hypothetical protein
VPDIHLFPARPGYPDELDTRGKVALKFDGHLRAICAAPPLLKGMRTSTPSTSSYCHLSSGHAFRSATVIRVRSGQRRPTGQDSAGVPAPDWSQLHGPMLCYITYHPTLCTATAASCPQSDTLQHGSILMQCQVVYHSSTPLITLPWVSLEDVHA